MQEGHSIPPESLKDEPFSPEETRPQTLVERDGHLCATCRAQKRILLTDEFTPQLCQLNGHDFARIRRSKSHAALADSIVSEMGHK